MKRSTKLAIALSAICVLATAPPASAHDKGSDRGGNAVIEVTVNCDDGLIHVASVAPEEGIRPHAINHIVLVHAGGETKLSRPTNPKNTREWYIDPAPYPGLTELRVKASSNGEHGHGHGGGEVFDYVALKDATCDSDGDGAMAAVDNCPTIANPGQEDLDLDGIGDACDLDADGDEVEVPLDCDDTDPAINPDAVELPDNDVDENCDGIKATTPQPAAVPVLTSIALPGSTVFSSGFAAADGWTTTGEWQVGPAVGATGTPVSPGGDPSMDASADDSNMIAGANPGGTISTAVHDYYWVTSPVIDLGGQPAGTLRYKRWLNSDYTPYMNNAVQVNDGSGWVTIWQSGGQPGIKDLSWTSIEHDLSMVTGPTIQVRFGYNVGSGGAYTVHGWNLDDVEITVG